MNDNNQQKNMLSNNNWIDFNKKNKSISSSYIQKMQLRHFLIFNIAPPIIAVTLFLTLYFSGQLVVTQVEITTAIILWVVSGLGITAGYHRLFTHRSYKATNLIKLLLHFSGLLAGQGTVISWAALHRQHHKFADKDGDPHSPNIHKNEVLNATQGLIHSHFTWMRKHDYPNVLHYVPDLIRDGHIIRMDNYYMPIFLTGIIVPGVLSFTFHATPGAFLSGVLIGGLIRLIVLGNTIWAINSFLHKFGTRPFPTKEQSHNFGFLAPFSFGESWHNNHHAFPGSAAFGLKWYELDFGFYFIKLMALFKLVENIKVPSKTLIHRSYHDHE